MKLIKQLSKRCLKQFLKETSIEIFITIPKAMAKEILQKTVESIIVIIVDGILEIIAEKNLIRTYNEMPKQVSKEK